MRFTIDNYNEAIEEVVSNRLLKAVFETIQKQNTNATLVDAEKAINDFFANRIVGRIDSDRFFFLKIPLELQKNLSEDDYMMVHESFCEAFMMGYQAGLQDLQELEREIDRNTQDFDDLPFGKELPHCKA